MGKTAVVGAERGTTFRVDPNDVIIIGRDTQDGPEHPLHDRRGLRDFDESIVEGMMVHGVIEPIVCRKNDDDRLEVIDGRGRVIDLREANKRLLAAGQPVKLVECLVRRYKPADVGGIKLITNTHRLDMDLWTLAEHAAQRRDQGHSLETIAMECKRTGDGAVKWVEGLISLLDVAPPVRAAIQSGALTYTGAVEIAKAPKDRQAAIMESAAATLAARGGTMVASGEAGPATPLPASTSRRGNGLTRAALAAAKAEKRASKGGAARPPKKPAVEPKYDVPTKTTLAKIANMGNDALAEHGLSPEVRQAIRWVLGVSPANTIAGLTSVLARFTGAVEK